MKILKEHTYIIICKINVYKYKTNNVSMTKSIIICRKKNLFFSQMKQMKSNGSEQKLCE